MSKVLPFAKVVKFEDKDDKIHALAVGKKLAALVLRRNDRPKNPKAKADRLVLLDKKSGAVTRELALTSDATHNGMVFNKTGALLFSTDAGLMSLNTDDANAQPQPVKLDGIKKPAQLATDKDGRLFVMDEGADAQVKVFADGKLQRAIGTRGSQRGLDYDAQALRGVQAISVADDGALWIAESPPHDGPQLGFVRRIAVFGADGKFARHFIGGTWYGANQVCLHEQDPTLALAYGVLYRIAPT